MWTLHLSPPPDPAGRPAPLTATPCPPPASTTVTWAPRPTTTTTSTSPSPAPSWVEEAPRPPSLCRAAPSSPSTSPLRPASRWITSPAPPPHDLWPAAPWNAPRSWATLRPPSWATRGRSLLPRHPVTPLWPGATRATVTTTGPAAPTSRITLASLSPPVPGMFVNLKSASPELPRRTTATTRRCTTHTTPTHTTPSWPPSAAPHRTTDADPPTQKVSHPFQPLPETVKHLL